MYVPGVDVLALIVPVVAFIDKPASAEKVPPVVPVTVTEILLLVGQNGPPV